MLLTLDPTAPVSLWMLGGGAVVVVGFILSVVVPFLFSLRSDIRAQSESNEKNELRELLARFDEPAVIRKIEAAAGPMVTAILKAHDEAQWVHRQALKEYPTMNDFTGGMNAVRSEIATLRDQLQRSDKERGEEHQELKEMIRDSMATLKKEFDQLRQNVAKAVGRKAGRTNDDELID